MRVLYFDPKFATPRRFAPTRAYSLARHLVEHGDEVAVVALDRRYMEPGRSAPADGGLFDRETIAGIDVVRVRVPYAQRFAQWKRMLAYGAYTLAAAAAAARLAR